MINHLKAHFILYGIYVGVLALFFVNSENCFFGDTVQLGSLHANFYFESNFTKLLLPNEFDSGHIPTFGVYIASAWKLFGRNLFVSHLAMLPFILALIYQLSVFIKNNIESRFKSFILLLVLLDPTLLSQLTLVSPDIPLLFFFFLALNSISKNKRFMLSICLFFLFSISMRGMMVAVILFIIDQYQNTNFDFSIRVFMKNILTRIKIYLPAIALFLLFNIFHFIQKGWIGFHKESPWAESFEPVDFIGFIYNIGILFWRLFDFGRIGVWIVFLVILFKFRNSILGRKEINFLFFIFISLFFILPLNMLWAKNLLGHRYLLPLFVIFSIFCAKLLFDLNFSKKIKVVLLSIWFTVIISGHFWIYPIGISQGWDSTTAHLPYYDLRKQAILYLEKNKIDFSEVKTFFPNTASIDVIELNNDDRNFDTYDSKCKYVFYSNIYNISDEVMKDLHFNFKTLQVFEKNRIFVKILVRI